MMLVALERTSTTTSTSNLIKEPEFIRGFSPSQSNFQSTEDQRCPSSSNMASIKEPEDLDSCSSSSIGRNSDSSRSSMDEDDDDTEVQSSLKGPLDTMDALEEVLPIRRGISKFYSGKSKSFTSLADASSTSSVQDLAKPDDAYKRKRKNLLACNHILDKNRNAIPLRSSSSSNNIGGISKRPMNSSRTTLGMVGVGTSSSESYNTSEENLNSSSSSPRLRPPLHPQAAKSSLNNAVSQSESPQRKISSWRSFSLTDLQGVAGAANCSTDHTVDNIIGPIKKLN